MNTFQMVKKDIEVCGVFYELETAMVKISNLPGRPYLSQEEIELSPNCQKWEESKSFAIQTLYKEYLASFEILKKWRETEWFDKTLDGLIPHTFFNK